MYNEQEYDSKYTRALNKIAKITLGCTYNHQWINKDHTLWHPGINDLHGMCVKLHHTEIISFLKDPNHVLLQWIDAGSDYNGKFLTTSEISRIKWKYGDRFINHKLFDSDYVARICSKIYQHKIYPEFMTNYTTNLDTLPQLKYPVVAKPDNEYSSFGLKAFKNSNKLMKHIKAHGTSFDTGIVDMYDKSKNWILKWDLFEEKYNIQNEFRVIMVNGKVNSIMERVQELGRNEHLFLKKANEISIMVYFPMLMKHNSFYEKIEQFCSSIDARNELSFYSIDVVLTKDGRLLLGEINIMPYMSNYQWYLLYMDVLQRTEMFSDGVDEDVRQFLIDMYVVPSHKKLKQTWGHMYDQLMEPVPTLGEIKKYLMKV